MTQDLSKVGVTNAEIEALEADRLTRPSVFIRVEHTFAPGVIVRTMYVPAETEVIGHEHKVQHINMLIKGSCEILAGDEVIRLKAPLIFVADAGVRKVARFHEESVWANILPNPTNETEPEKIEELFVVKSATYRAHKLISACALETT